MCYAKGGKVELMTDVQDIAQLLIEKDERHELFIAQGWLCWLCYHHRVNWGSPDHVRALVIRRRKRVSLFSMDRITICHWDNNRKG